MGYRPPTAFFQKTCYFFLKKHAIKVPKNMKNMPNHSTKNMKTCFTAISFLTFTVRISYASELYVTLILTDGPQTTALTESIRFCPVLGEGFQSFWAYLNSTSL